MPNTNVPAAGEAMPAAIIGRFSHRVLQPYGMPKGMNPRQWRQSVEKRLNDLLDRAMSLITALDLMEADCDLEDTADDEDSHDAEGYLPEDYGETIMWGDGLASQEVLVGSGL